jgi:hypothetical protein
MLSESGASTEPRYSPRLRMMMTRQLRRLAGFSGLVRRGCSLTQSQCLDGLANDVMVGNQG